MKRWPFVVAITMLFGTWSLLQSLSHGESALPRKPFAEFPLTLGERWQGKELGMAPEILAVLKLSDYMMRVYVPTGRARGDGREAIGTPDTGTPVWLYVGYYQSQRTGATYHSPRNCLPGAGWQVVESDQVTLTTDGAGPSVMKKVLIEKGLEKQLVLYWYQDRGRIIASEYWAKAFLIWDAMTKNRTDGALIRITVPVVTNQELAYQHALSFVRDIWSPLKEHLPSNGISS